MKRLWEFGIPLIGGRALTMRQLHELLKDCFQEPLLNHVRATPDWLHALRRGLFTPQGEQIPIQERSRWRDLADEPDGKMTHYLEFQVR
jgi:hypothetical protein